MILCADDYGISPGVSLGIRGLLERRRLSATSCMVVFPDAEEDVRQLREHWGVADIGLHLVLTDHSPVGVRDSASGLLDEDGTLQRFPRLAQRAYSGRIDPNSVAAEVAAQVDRFIEWTGAPPSFIDGHQHAHQLPRVREGVIQALQRDTRLREVYVRVSTMPRLRPSSWIESPSWSTVIGGRWISLPSAGARLALGSAGIRTNRTLLGYYPANKGIRFSDVFSWYAGLAAGTHDLFHCHPGFVDPTLEARDALLSEREEVLEFLASDAFATCLEQTNIALNRFGA